MKTKPYYLVLPFILILFGLVSCSFNGQKTDVSIIIPEEVCQNVFASKSEVQVQGAEKIIEITLFVNSTLEQKESIAYDGKKGVSKYFYNIPARAEVYAEVRFIARENGKDIVLATGKSDTTIVTANKEVLLSVIIKLEKESPDKPDNPIDDPDKQNENPDDPNEPEQPVVDTTIYIYVSSSGSDTEGDGTEEKPFKTIGGACNKIIEAGKSDSVWGIKIKGIVSGDPTSNSDKYGQSIIPEEITSDKAKSILLTGATGLDENNIPQDAVNRGQSNYQNPVTNGNVLIINTVVPVTITNLMITGGVHSYGAGINIAEGATVGLGDGVLIIGNRAKTNGRGGGVHNEGTLFMYGSAVIGDKSMKKYSSQSSTAKIPELDSEGNLKTENAVEANYSACGGGIYNGSDVSGSTVSAKLYLGYCGFENDGVTPKKQTLTGGIYFNGASTGGAIYNNGKSIVYFDSGNLEWNCASGSGGAVSNNAGGTFIMTGGNILNNRSYEGGGYTSGAGGVQNAGSESLFIMSGGIINKNNSASATSRAGGLSNSGKFFMYGTAVIGDDTATTVATAESYGNIAQQGAGVYNASTGFVYLGYKPDSEGNPVEEELTGGIYYNYSSTASEAGGGAIYNYGGNNGGQFKIASGTIAYNATAKNGGAIWHRQSNYAAPEISGGTIRDNYAANQGGAFYTPASYYATDKTSLIIKGNLSIPEGSDGKNDLCLGSSTSSEYYYANITIGGALGSAFAAKLSTENYYESKQLLKLAADAGTTIAQEYTKFSISPEVNTDTGTSAEWVIDNEGKIHSVYPFANVTVYLSDPDIGVKVTYNGGYDYNGSGSIMGRQNVIFTADAGYTYNWFIDGESPDGTVATVSDSEGKSILTIDTRKLVPGGVYDVVLDAVKDGVRYSYMAQIKVVNSQ